MSIVPLRGVYLASSTRARRGIGCRTGTPTCAIGRASIAAASCRTPDPPSGRPGVVLVRRTPARSPDLVGGHGRLAGFQHSLAPTDHALGDADLARPALRGGGCPHGLLQPPVVGRLEVGLMPGACVLTKERRIGRLHGLLLLALNGVCP